MELRSWQLVAKEQRAQPQPPTIPIVPVLVKVPLGVEVAVDVPEGPVAQAGMFELVDRLWPRGSVEVPDPDPDPDWRCCCCC